jgi:hypothetical protein
VSLKHQGDDPPHAAVQTAHQLQVYSHYAIVSTPLVPSKSMVNVSVFKRVTLEP